MGAGCCKEEAIDFSGEIELSHFHLLRSVGKGAFGKVRVVQHKRTKEIYALKYINKAKCIRMRAVENIIQERRLLEEVEFSLICNLRYAFQDDENLFMILDLMLGGDLRFHLERAGPMGENAVRFYVAELALALDALHSRRIIHRDLKPDNVLLDEHGHAHLTDFNIAVYYNPAKPLVSIAGSMAYMAPEVLLRKGYLESVDWWSLGVVMFELLFGKRPFRGKSNDLLTQSILRDPLPFPPNASDIVSAQCMDVLSKLCERDISKRLGCTSEGIDAFKKHPWFQKIEWDKLVTKEAIPPFEPDSKRANFDATHELEELLMEDNPLKAKKRALMDPNTELSTEMQMMEDKFTVYDFTKVRRSHSVSYGRILRPINDPKLSSGTLDGAVARPSTGRLETLSLMPPPKVYRPDSPSDRIGQDRFNADDDKLPLTSPSYRVSPQNSPPLAAPSKSHGSNDHFRFKSDSEKAGYFELQPQQQQQQQQRQRGVQLKLETRDLEELMQSEPIVLPPSSLPRPLQPRDQVTGHRVGSPRHNVTSIPAMTATPSSPPISYAPSTPPKPAQQQPGAVLFSPPDSGVSLSSPPSNYNGPEDPLQDPTGIAPVSRRAVRGRESSHAVNSMPAAVPSPSIINPRVSSQHQTNNNNAGNLSAVGARRQLDTSTTQQQQSQPHQIRPMSEFTPSKSSALFDIGSDAQPMPVSNQLQASASSTRGEDNNMYRQQQQPQQYTAH